LDFTARRRNFRQAVEKSGSAPENSTSHRILRRRVVISGEPSENLARRWIFPGRRRNFRQAVGKFGAPFLFTAGRRNFGRAAEKYGGVPEN